MSNQHPQVSILMTAFNREQYIRTAIESVLQSTFSDYELVIVDDHSSDKTVAIAREVADKDQRIKIHVNEQNLGDYANRNRAASLATGEYLKYLDSDDYIYPWGLQLLVQMMDKFPECGWGLCSLVQDRERPYPFPLTPREAYEYNFLGPGLFHKAPLSSIIRRKVFEEAGGFKVQRMVGDFELWHRLGLKYNVLLMPEGIVWNREHAGQEVKSYNKYAVDYERIMVTYLTSPDCPLDRETIQKILRRQKNRNRIELMKSVLKFNAELIGINRGKLKFY